jgi:hypothetical protein
VALAHLRESIFSIGCLRSAGKPKSRQDPLYGFRRSGGIGRNQRSTLHQLFWLSE